MKYLFSFFLAALLFVPSGAHALSLGGIFGCGAAEVGGAVSTATKSAVLSTAAVTVNAPVTNQQLETQNTKDCVLDGMVVAIRQGIISATTQSIVNWINSGFEGGPSFVTNLNRFLGEIADQTSLDFIRGTELGFLCSPFSIDVRIALATQRQPFYQRVECSLGEVVGNTEKFFQGEFSQGGWQGWFRAATNFQNNPYGAYYIASKELEARIVSNQGEELSLLQYGEGFRSPRECVEYKVDPETGEQGECLEYEITTPGAVVNETLSTQLTSGIRQLELADEIDEIINALMAQLAQQVVTGVRGLRGLSERSGGQGSFLERLSDESSANARSAVGSTVGNDIDGSIELQEEYEAFIESLLERVETWNDMLAFFESCSGTFSETEREALLAYGIVGENDSARINAIRERIATSQLRWEAQQEFASTIVVDLITIRSEMNRARDLTQMEPAILSYDNLIRNGRLRTGTDLSALETERLTLEELMGVVGSAINRACVAAS